jgi:hypothetical protein
MIFAEGFSDKAIEQLGEITKVAAWKSPELYLVILFSLACLVITTRFVKHRDDKDERRQERHMDHVKELTESNNTNHKETVQLAAQAMDRLGDRLDENTRAVQILSQKSP